MDCSCFSFLGSRLHGLLEGHSEVFTFGKCMFSDVEPGRFWIKNDSVLQVACGDEHTALLTASGRIFTFGSNAWGQLGHGSTTPFTTPTLVKDLYGEYATVLACGKSHTLVATDSGRCFGFGCNSDNQLGCEDGEIHQTPTPVQGLTGVNIQMLAAGAEHSIALTEDGAVFVWGGNGEGQLGLGDQHSAPSPTELQLGSRATCISSGYYHSAVITIGGKLLTFGESEGGKLGLEHYAHKESNCPQLVTGIEEELTWVSCGGQHTLVISANGKAYGFGDGRSGQLGLGPEKLYSHLPQQVKSLENERITNISCGESHTAFLTGNGVLYMCGDGRHSKLALSDDQCSSNQFIPQLVTFFLNMTVHQVSCGGCHTVVLAEKSLMGALIKDTPSSVKISQGARARRRQRKHSLGCQEPEQICQVPNLDLNEDLETTVEEGFGEPEVKHTTNEHQSCLQIPQVHKTEDKTTRHADSDEVDINDNGESEHEAVVHDSSNETFKKASSDNRKKSPSGLTQLFKSERHKSSSHTVKSQSVFYDDSAEIIESKESESHEVNKVEAKNRTTKKQSTACIIL